MTGCHDDESHVLLLDRRLKNVTVEILQCPRCGEVSIGWYLQTNTEDITTEKRKETTTLMTEKLDLREWVEKEIPLMMEAAEKHRGNPEWYKAVVESILTLQHIRHTAIYDAREAMLDPLGNPPDEPASKPEDDAPNAPVDEAPTEPPLEKSDVRAKLVELKNAGLNLKELWDKFGVTGLSGVDPKDYRKLLKTAEELLG